MNNYVIWPIISKEINKTQSRTCYRTFDDKFLLLLLINWLTTTSVPPPKTIDEKNYSK